MAISTREVQLKMLIEMIEFRDKPCKPLDPWEDLHRFRCLLRDLNARERCRKKDCCIATVQVAGALNRGKIVNSLF